MISVLRARTSLVWFVLVTLTIVSWSLGTSHGVASSHVLATLVIFVVAVFKAWLVGFYFMDLRNAPGWLRGIFVGYCLLLFGLLTTMFLIG